MPRRKLTADVPPPAKYSPAPAFGPNRDELAQAAGSGSVAFAMTLFQGVADGVSRPSSDVVFNRTLQARFDALRGLEPRDEAEGMLAAQMVTAHNAAMDCMRRSVLPEQTFEGREQNLKFATKFMAVYERQLSALDRRRGGGQQNTTVENVNVHAGGRAIVGDVTTHQLARAAPPLPAPPPPLARKLADNSAASGNGDQLRQDCSSKAVKTKKKKRPRR